jgi:hypothetical protein
MLYSDHRMMLHELQYLGADTPACGRIALSVGCGALYEGKSGLGNNIAVRRPGGHHDKHYDIQAVFAHGPL